jgi:hypothetical protein
MTIKSVGGEGRRNEDVSEFFFFFFFFKSSCLGMTFASLTYGMIKDKAELLVTFNWSLNARLSAGTINGLWFCTKWTLVRFERDLLGWILVDFHLGFIDSLLGSSVLLTLWLIKEQYTIILYKVSLHYNKPLTHNTINEKVIYTEKLLYQTPYSQTILKGTLYTSVKLLLIPNTV